MVSYKPLYETMKKRKISTYALIKHGINPRTVNNIKHGKGISTYTIEKLCVLLECTPNDVLEFVYDENEDEDEE